MIFIRNFPAGAAQNPDDAAKLTTSYSLPGGVAYATTVQVDVKDNLATETNVVIIQVQRKGVTRNETLTYEVFITDNAPFVAGDHRTSLHMRCFSITGLRIGLSLTATNIYAS